MKETTGIIILAAGGSSRLGQPKQLLLFNGSSLLKHVVNQATAENYAAVVVVTGAEEALVRQEIESPAVRLVSNPDWESGMASSVKTGLERLLKEFPEIDNCIVSVCDQPHISTGIFRRLREKREHTGKGIVASFYAETSGVPVLFSKDYFGALLELSGQEGAKSLLKKHKEDVGAVPFEGGEIDIDTVEDYQKLSRNMISVPEAKQIIREVVTGRGRSQIRVPIGEATGFTLAEDVFAQIDIPNFFQSSMDGYAIRFEDRNEALEVIGEMTAGARSQLSVGPGQATRIFTGAPLPEGADTVVMQERTAIENDRLICRDEGLLAAANVRKKGAEIEAGQLAIASGSRLSPASVGYLSGIGCGEVAVFAAPRVTIVLTGNELQTPGQELQFGQVYEANAAQLMGALKRAGVENAALSHAVDDPVVLKEALEKALVDSDMVLLVGGVSVGDYDYVTRVVAECGVIRQFHKIRQKPGKPLFFGTKGQQLIFGLPGNPSSSLTCFYEYVLPAIEGMMGFSEAVTPVVAKVTHDYKKPVGLTHFLKANYEKGLVTPLHAQESFRLQSFAQANCFLVLGEASEGCQAGDEVEVHLLPL